MINVTWKDFSNFVKFSGGMKHIVFLVFLSLVFYLSEMSLIWYIGQWTKDGIKQKSENRKYTLIVLMIAIVNSFSWITRYLY